MTSKRPKTRRQELSALAPPVWGARGRRIVETAAPLVRPDFSPACLDFERGIRVGNLEPQQRITRILKAALEARHATAFTTDRWGRGVYWQWICWVPLENRKAKPLSSKYNFGSAKFFIALDTDDQTFEAGLQIERAPLRTAGDAVRAQKDWDFFNVEPGLRRGKALAREIERLVKDEGFTVRAGDFAEMTVFTAANFKGVAPLARACRDMPPGEWGGFQLCYVLSKADLQGLGGDEIIATILAIFDEVAPAMNAVMTVPCLGGRRPPGAGEQENR
jgi:hypothetical protein